MVVLDSHCQALMDEYRANLPVFETMLGIVRNQLEKCVADNDIYVNAIEARIKTESSLAGKLKLKGSKYKTLSDLTDILGTRVITFYTDEVDKIAALAEKIFEIDWENSVDKRKRLEMDQFGYQSLHYICRIPESVYCDPEHPEINKFRFELQMRTALQHVWANINHDSGYKSGVEIPKEYLRNMLRLAGMLELADEQFSRIRIELSNYRRQVQSVVANGDFNSVALNGDTFASYLSLNPFKKLVDKIAAINQAEVFEDDLRGYLTPLIKMGMSTLGDIERMREDCQDAAYQLSLHQIAGTDLDIVAQSVALQNLCVVQIVKDGGSVRDLAAFYGVLNGESGYNMNRAKRIMNQVQKINII